MEIIQIRNFLDASLYGSDTVWCTSHDENIFNVYIKDFDMFIIIDKDGDYGFDKICYLRGKEGDFFVGRDNIHRYNDKGVIGDVYRKLMEKYREFLF